MLQFSDMHLEAFLAAYRDHVASVHEDGVVGIDGIQPQPPFALDRIDQTDLPLDEQYHYYNQASGVHVYIVDTVRCTPGGDAVGGVAREPQHRDLSSRTST